MGSPTYNIIYLYIYTYTCVFLQKIMYVYTNIHAVYFYTQQKYCNLFAFKSSCFKHTIRVPLAKSCHQHPKATHMDTTEDPNSPNHGICGLQIYSLQWAIQDLKIGSCQDFMRQFKREGVMVFRRRAMARVLRFVVEGLAVFKVLKAR